MEIYFVKLECPINGNLQEKIKATSSEDAKTKANTKYPNCKIISVRQLLND